MIGYGQPEFPAFWSRNSGLAAPLQMNTAGEIAKAHMIRAALGLPGGQLVGNHVPKEAEISRGALAPIIEQAQGEAQAQGITGKAVTPFLLARIFELTDGRSLVTNIALVLNNARLAAQIAGELKS